jgi:hypothetical protein
MRENGCCAEIRLQGARRETNAAAEKIPLYVLPAEPERSFIIEARAGASLRSQRK